MNHIYRLIWNARAGNWVAASELTRARGKRTRTSQRQRLLFGALLSVAAVASQAQTLPTGGAISAGQGTIEQSGNTLTVTQSSKDLVVNWQQFNIGEHETVSFVQPGASSIALNRVVGSDASQILGKLNATGQVWLLNPNGVLFGQHAQVDVGGLVASTLNLSDADFLSGERTFSGAGGSLVNYGQISARDGGYVALLGGHVSNEGVISARLGTVALGAGERIRLDFADDALLNLSVDRGALGALVENHQLIRADGGRVLMTARATSAVLDTVVNNAGIIEAHTIEHQGGVIKLRGGFEGGSVNVAGTLDASAPEGGEGGFIDTSGHSVRIGDTARITTAAAAGRTGTWLIDPNDYTIAASGGDITGAALAARLGSNNVVIESVDGANAAGNGDVFVNDAVSWSANTTLTLRAERNIEVNAAIDNSGGGNLVLRADTEGTSAGTVHFNGGAVSMNGGRTDLYYNAVGAPTDYSSHVTGAYTAWMLVNNVGQLQAMSSSPIANYALGRDIDAAVTASWNGGAGFVPLDFNGNFDGLGHTVTDLIINRPSTDAVGLFGRSGLGSTIRNVGIVGGNIRGRAYTGALVGYNSGSVERSYSTGAVGGVDYVGGLIGYNGGPVSDSYSSVMVNGGPNVVGGLIGQNVSTVSRSYASGAVHGYANAGGLVGVNTGTVAQVYATGAVNGVLAVGGLVGTNAWYVTESYSTGAVTGTSDVGGLIGANALSHVTNSYWDTQTSGTSIGVGTGPAAGTGLTTAQMMQAANFTGFDFTTGWWMSENDTRPFLRSEYSTTIHNAHQLQLMALDLNAHYELATNIDMGELTRASGLWSSSGFVPVGSASGEFKGTFDGLGHTITDLIIDRPMSDQIGLFGSLTGTVTNVGLVGSSIRGHNETGALAGSLNDGCGGCSGTVEGSYSTGTVTGDTSVGGLVGANSGRVARSYSSATVAGTDSVGGLIGSNNRIVQSTYSTGLVSGGGQVGGFVGYNGGSISASFWDTQTSSTSIGVGSGSSSSGLTGWTTAQMMRFVTFSTLDISSTGGSNAVWRIYDGQSYPLLRAFLSPLTISANDAAKTYDGVSWSGGSGVTYAGFKTGESASNLLGTLSYVGPAQGARNAGSYMLRGSGVYSDQQGYDIKYVAGTLTIDKRALTIGALGQNRIYDGTTAATVTLNDNRVAGDNLTLNYAAAFADKNVGADKTVSVTSIGVTGARAGNYTWNTTASTTADIDRATLIVSGASAQNRGYDGTTAATINGATLSGVIGADDVMLTGAGVGTFADKNAGTGKAVSTAMGLSGVDAANYVLDQPLALIADIRARALLISASGQGKTYDGTAATLVTLSDDRVRGDDLTLSYAAAAFADKNAGQDKAVSVTSIGVTGTDAGNYTWNTTSITTADINHASLTVIGASAQNRVYDGTTAATINGATLSGVVGADAVMLTNAGAGRFVDKNAGTAKAVSTSMGLSGVDAANYVLDQPLGLAADISTRELLISAFGENRFYDGTTEARVTLRDNRVTGDVLTLGYGGADFIDALAGSGKQIDVRGITVRGADAGNYRWNVSAQTAANISPPAERFPLTLEAVLPEIAIDERADVSLPWAPRLVNRGIRLPRGLDAER